MRVLMPEPVERNEVKKWEVASEISCDTVPTCSPLGRGEEGPNTAEETESTGMGMVGDRSKEARASEMNWRRPMGCEELRGGFDCTSSILRSSARKGMVRGRSWERSVFQWKMECAAAWLEICRCMPTKQRKKAVHTEMCWVNSDSSGCMKEGCEAMRDSEYLVSSTTRARSWRCKWVSRSSRGDSGSMQEKVEGVTKWRNG